MEKKRKPESGPPKEADTERKERKGVSETVKANARDKEAIVKDLPKDIGRHGTDNEKDLNPEE